MTNITATKFSVFCPKQNSFDFLSIKSPDKYKYFNWNFKNLIPLFIPNISHKISLRFHTLLWKGSWYFACFTLLRNIEIKNNLHAKNVFFMSVEFFIKCCIKRQVHNEKKIRLYVKTNLGFFSREAPSLY